MNRKPTRLVVFGALVLGVLVPAAGASAQRNFDVDRLVPALDGDGFLGFQGTRTPGSWHWNVGFSGTWARKPLFLRDEARVDTVIQNRFMGDFIAQVGLGGRLALAIDAPVLFYQSVDETQLLDGGGAVPANAIGDPRLTARYRFHGESSDVVRDRSEGLGVAAVVASTVPVGNDDAFLGEGSTRADGQIVADYNVLGVGIGVMMGYRHRFSPREFYGVRFRDELSLGLGLKTPVIVIDDLYAIAEARGTTDVGSPFGDGPRTAVEADLGLRFVRGDLALTGAAGTGVSGGVGEPAVRALVSASWAPRVQDSDLDGVSDDRDACKFLPEDLDGFEDTDGCPDRDNDGDMVPDEDDRCPDESAVEGRDEDEDGCTDPFRDADGDGIGDAEDTCSDRPEDFDDFEDEDGCPDPDNDHDGVADATDRCPTDVEDADGFQDDDGCPDLDNDGDGILDAIDACPRSAEDVDGFEDTNGCPDPDNDRDGVVDANDRCPDAREDIDGVADDDGCPEPGGTAAWTVSAEGDMATFRIEGRLRFGSSNDLQPRALPMVDQLARLILARWSFDLRVAIGATELSRVDALKAALVARGVPENQVVVEHDAALHGPTVVVTWIPPATPAGEPAAPPLPED